MNVDYGKTNNDAVDFEIQRHVYSYNEFENQYVRANRRDNNKQNLKEKILDLLKFYKLFSIIDMFVTYDFKKMFLKDFISGLTVGIMHIPQGLAYGSLTSLTPIYGLYTSFFPGNFPLMILIIY